MQKNFDFIHRLQTRTAMLAIGRSTLRNQGAPGMVAHAREFLGGIDLSKFSTISIEQFTEQLNIETNSLADSFPSEGKGNWGAARKSINIFLRDVLYSRHLCEHFNLAYIEPWLEVPLDSDVYNGLSLDSNEALPKWPRIRNLDSKISNNLQNIATNIAQSLGVYRIHLDVLYWRRELVNNLQANPSFKRDA